MSAYRDKFGVGVSEDVFAVTPADAPGVTDGTVVRDVVRQIYCNGAGNLKYTSTSGVTNTIPIAAGFFLQCAITKVWATGTTATGLLGYV